MEHLTNSKLIFKSFDRQPGQIKCANKNGNANLRLQGVGSIEVLANDNKILKIDNVIYVENLTETLLSLRKFTDLGLCVYFDNKQIDIYDPMSKESYISGIYQKSYWIIEFEINKATVHSNVERNRAVAYITTRNMTKRNTTETVEASENESETEDKDCITDTVTCSDFDNTIRDRKISDVNEARENENPTCDISWKRS